MVDKLNKKRRSENMRQIRSKDTGPEMVVRSFLHRNGYRYVLHDKRLPGRPDIVFPRIQAAIQVRGCFWHGHTCRDGHVPKTRQSYWAPKLQGNKERDRKNDRRLRRAGWRVLNVWECETNDADRLAKKLLRFLS